MHTEHLSDWTHEHVFDTGNQAAERGTRVVMWITAAMMVVEIACGWWFNSMALLADGWHMSSHAVAIGLSALAYATARRYAKDPRFAFGTWKVEILGGFASAIFLLGVAAMMLVSSVERIFAPQPIRYEEAIAIAILGLLVNVVCALILGKAHHHGHGHDHGHGHHHGHDHGRGHGQAGAHAHAPHGAHAHGGDGQASRVHEAQADAVHDQRAHEHGVQGRAAHGHGTHDHGAHDHGANGHGADSHGAQETHDHAAHESHGHDTQHGHDLNLKSAYLHVIADAATSVLAIAALFGGWMFGWSWLDPVMGIVGAVLVAVWAKGLIAETGKVLLDREMDHPVVAEIREVVETGLEAGETKITDLHVWRVGKSVYSCALTVVTHDAQLTADAVRERLAIHEEIVHSTIEIHRCPA